MGAGVFSISSLTRMSWLYLYFMVETTARSISIGREEGSLVCI